MLNYQRVKFWSRYPPSGQRFYDPSCVVLSRTRKSWNAGWRSCEQHRGATRMARDNCGSCPSNRRGPQALGLIFGKQLQLWFLKWPLVMGNMIAQYSIFSVCSHFPFILLNQIPLCFQVGSPSSPQDVPYVPQFFVGQSSILAGCPTSSLYHQVLYHSDQVLQDIVVSLPSIGC